MSLAFAEPKKLKSLLSDSPEEPDERVPGDPEPALVSPAADLQGDYEPGEADRWWEAPSRH